MTLDDVKKEIQEFFADGSIEATGNVLEKPSLK